MRYMVEVNAKYMVSVEADSQLQAEHKILNEHDGCWGALAFDAKMMKTDTFAGAAMTCETISLRELQSMATDLTEKSIAYGDANEEVKAQEAEIEELERRLKEAEEALARMKARRAAARAAMRQAAEKIGERQN